MFVIKEALFPLLHFGPNYTNPFINTLWERPAFHSCVSHPLMTNLALMRLLIMQYVVVQHIMAYRVAPWIFKSTL